MKSKLKYALFPLALVYDGITRTRNYLYRKKFFASTSFQLPILVVGNLAIGGTGKTPHTEFILSFLQKTRKVAMLSRGYGRRSKGFILADKKSTAKLIGDEPLQVHQNFPNIPVAVCENRVLGVQQLIDNINPEVIVLDDAFQHRKLKGSLYILLTTYYNLIPNDFVLPMGKLREAGSNITRADAIVVSKCPSNMLLKEKKRISKELCPEQNKPIFFSCISYQEPKQISGEAQDKKIFKALLVTAIVNNTPLQNHLEEQRLEVTTLTYRDHYHYTQKDVATINQKLQELGPNAAIFTTSKDAVKLKPLLKKYSPNILAFEVPIGVKFLFDQEKEFKNLILHHVNSF